ncbi:hypothetical protein HN018_23250 (plasmid) [Lichenicola cladoniae]|uniref:Uncharacterized protein n=1 Tax=Lichenicola cladoniae TaxID=1484109 RepID=A0A6M8HY01_9PROT|nr:hypothetical protein [Acetobacteraceae bacterium]QKE93282.1 hypothetical protein HN018_23250 [Lichenicola cladoniae]
MPMIEAPSRHRMPAALAFAAAAVARLDQVVTGHPLCGAFLYRTRLEAVRRQAAVDGHSIDPWHLAAVIEGLRPRIDQSLEPYDRGSLIDAARYAFDGYQWLVRPTFEQEDAIRTAGLSFPLVTEAATLLAGASALHSWLEAGGTRQAGRAALLRFWMQQKIMRVPVPLTAAASLGADVPWAREAWIPIFLDTLAAEAGEGLQLLMTMERAWCDARQAVAGGRRHSRAGLAVDLLAACPVMSATSLACGLDMAVKNAAQLLDRFLAEGLVVEVTHRHKRRLFGLKALTPLREGTAPPRRPEPGRNRGRPRRQRKDESDEVAMPAPVLVLDPFQRRAVDYSGLEAAMAYADKAIDRAQRMLKSLEEN